VGIDTRSQFQRASAGGGFGPRGAQAPQSFPSGRDAEAESLIRADGSPSLPAFGEK